MSCCNELKPHQLLDFLRGRMPGERGKNIKRHLSSCQDCRKTAKELKRIDALIRGGTPNFPDQKEEELLQFAREHIEQPQRDRSRETRENAAKEKIGPENKPTSTSRTRRQNGRSGRRRKKSSLPSGAIAAAAAVLVAFVVGMVVMNSSDQPQQPPSEPNTRTIAVIDQMSSGVQLFRNTESIEVSEGAELRRNDRLNVPVGDQARFRYKNENTTIQLKGGTQVTLRKEEKTKRIHLRDGTLEADVAEQRGDRKLVTTMPLGRAEIIGTKFQLSYDKKARLEVDEGTVKFTSTKTNDSVMVRKEEYGEIAPDGALSHGPIELEKPEEPSEPKNKPPVADAGEDIMLVDSDLDGKEQVTLNGSESEDLDGRISDYVWKKQNETIATGKKPSLALNTGRHEIVLVITDDGGKRARDQLIVHVREKQMDLKEGLVGYWPLDEQSGKVANDRSGFENHGKLMGRPEWKKGSKGNALKFDGTDDYVKIPHHDQYLLNEGTIALWFNTRKLPSADTESPILHKEAGGYGTGGHLRIKVANKKVVVSLQSTSDTYKVQSTETIKTGRWYHVTFTWGSQGMHLYVNGTGSAENQYSGGLDTSSGGEGNYEPIVLGASAGRSSNRSATPLDGFFDGFIDDVRWYNRTLSDSEIKKLVR